MGTENMDEKEVLRSLGTDRWMMDLGLIPPSVEQNIVAFGYLSSDKVVNVEADIDVNKKSVAYKLTLDGEAYARWTLSAKLLKDQRGGLVGKGMRLLGLKLNDDLRMEERLGKMMKDYLPSYSMTLEVLKNG